MANRDSFFICCLGGEDATAHAHRANTRAQLKADKYEAEQKGHVDRVAEIQEDLDKLDQAESSIVSMYVAGLVCCLILVTSLVVFGAVRNS